ncbi:MAG: sulfatase family protein [Sphingobacterium sp.]|uniref:sulfatase family protein n=1 Tax=Sphingobacterium sp. JB170 TaxID=1434842 RepID=UPI00097F0066|nr:sulfatase [Sphingobacterium sp. JB170]SJN27318.1 Choline-sulfatase [Sphingobacterium sp. JB170]
MSLTRESGLTKLKAMKAVFITFMNVAIATCAFGQVEQKQPNIIFIMSDDHAEQAISAYGHPISKVAPTPNIDRIAKDGAIFMNNYCSNSICGPSRAAILTGKHSHKNGFMKNGNKGFDGTQQTLPKILRANGYQTAVIGKWHLLSRPTGFDYWSVLNDQGDYYNPYFITGQDTTRHMGYVTDLITDFTKQWMKDRDQSKPFFLMMHHKAPHRNWVPAERHYRLYEDAKFPVPANYWDDYKGRFAAGKQEMNIYRDMYEGHDLKMVTGVDSDSLLFDPWPHAFMGTMTEPERERFFEAYRDRNNDFYSIPRSEREVAEWKYQRYLQDYTATVKSVDESVGEILDYLKASGLDKNTIVVYTTDQGFYLGEHGWFDKRFMYEESFGMPLLMSYPGHIKPGTKVTGLTQNIDFAPTFLDICGIDIPLDIQGMSFKSLVEDGKTPNNWRQSLYYHYYEFPGFHSVRAHYGVKMERYKLMYFYKDDRWELYDLKEDPSEMHNIYAKSGTDKITRDLKKELVRLQDQYDVNEEYRK